MILGIKTDGQTTRLWLLETAPQHTPEPSVEWESGRELSAQLLGRIQDLVEAHNQLTSLTGIVVYEGPGSFTSLRIGHTIANALADSLGITIASASGDDWLPAAAAKLATTPPGRPVMPLYGAEPHLTIR